MNQIKNVKVLEGLLLLQMSEWFPDQDFIFQQDGAQCYTGKIDVKWFKDNKI